MFRALGKGAFGMVSAVQKKDTKKIYAMKQMKKKKVKHYHSEKLCEIEKSALQKMDSPFVLNLKYSFTHDKSLFLVIELCNGGDLQFHLQEVRSHRFSEERARFYAAEVILALEHLHNKKFVYRDLKPGNILLDNEGSHLPSL
jgi:serine/threonine protein kinase